MRGREEWEIDLLGGRSVVEGGWSDFSDFRRAKFTLRRCLWVLCILRRKIFSLWRLWEIFFQRLNARAHQGVRLYFLLMFSMVFAAFRVFAFLYSCSREIILFVQIFVSALDVFLFFSEIYLYPHVLTIWKIIYYAWIKFNISIK